MWIPKDATLIRGRGLFKVRRLFEEIRYPKKIKVSQAQSNWFVFKEAPAYKKEIRRSAYLRFE